MVLDVGSYYTTRVEVADRLVLLCREIRCKNSGKFPGTQKDF